MDANTDLLMVVICYAIGGITGCHIKPAVTIFMLIAGEIKPNEALIYILAQLIGVLIASLLLMIILEGMPHFEMGRMGIRC